MALRVKRIAVPAHACADPVGREQRLDLRQDLRMAVDVTVEAVIDRALADVAAYAGDPSNAPKWYSNIRSVRWRTPPPLGDLILLYRTACFGS